MYTYDIDFDEDVENNYEQDRIPDIINPYLGLPLPTQTFQREEATVTEYCYTAKKERIHKKLSLKKKPKLTIATK
ncbi:hypothetical protein AKO1_012505 [Acrasis kona]|uniref:Uncharacterized protein n=1 Tax=Acrasis kona TaxID=1008807 RepID=A0AAW2YVT8_9EUKA